MAPAQFALRCLGLWLVGLALYSIYTIYRGAILHQYRDKFKLISEPLWRREL